LVPDRWGSRWATNEGKEEDKERKGRNKYREVKASKAGT
jgi:hypothetical protein